MRQLNWKSLLTAGAFALCAAVAVAQDNSKGEPQGMPPMGPPEEMKQCAMMAGTWDAVMKFKMAPTDTNWMETKAVATMNYAVGGAVMAMTYESSMMGMPFLGASWETYDRENKNWQMSWVDNMSARIGLYTGVRTKDGSVYSGEDKMMGQTYKSRISVSNATADSFDWMAENSTDGGKTWWVWGTAKYTKRK